MIRRCAARRRRPSIKNGFVVGCERTRECGHHRPGDEVDELLGAVRDTTLRSAPILLTHAHVDHVTGVRCAKSAYGVPVYLHENDLPFTTTPCSRAACSA